MKLFNSTSLSTPRLAALLGRYVEGWPHEPLTVRVRYSRGAEYSGMCYYSPAKIFINIRRRLRFPRKLGTNLARAQSNRTHWWREVYYIELADAYQLVLLVFLHEFYHWLIRCAGRNPRQKEGMCDRFAARALVDDFGVAVLREGGQPVDRSAWDFHDFERFVAAARTWHPRAPRRRTRRASARA